MTLWWPPGPPERTHWVIGAGGLLGTAVTDALRRRGNDIVLTSAVSWTTGRTDADLAAGLAEFGRIVAAVGTPWRISWCAGAGVTGSTDAELDREVNTLRTFLAVLAERTDLPPGLVFLASSAGGIYAGGTGGPYTELAPERPISAYGRAKLAAEAVAAEFARHSGTPVRIGRIANLYGPGQDLTKGQGLVSQLCRGAVNRTPVSVYVSLDTIRDYLFVRDCAALLLDLLETPARPAGSDLVIIKVLASGQGTTIGELVAACRQVFKRRPLLILGASPNARFQVKDLRLSSVVLPELDRRSCTPLPVGIAATAAAMLRTIQAGRH